MGLEWGKEEGFDSSVIKARKEELVLPPSLMVWWE